MDVFVYYKKNTIKEPLEKEVLWYDLFWKKLKKFNCTRLSYEWKEVDYIKLDSGEAISVEAGIKKFVEYMKNNPDKFESTFFPEKFAEKYLKENNYIKKYSYWQANPITHYKESSHTDKKAFEDWYSEYNEGFITITQTTDEGVVINIPEDNKKELEDIIISLDQGGFRYEITG